MNNLIHIHEHSIITVVIMTIALLLGVELYMALLLIGFWFGREHNQAEMRYMRAHKLNRNTLGFFDGFRLSAWNMDSFVNDLAIPCVIGVSYVLV